MKTHYCPEEKDWIAFEGECSWCGMTEKDIATTDEQFRELIAKMQKAAKPHINDD